jgi:hypothetical protein
MAPRDARRAWTVAKYGFTPLAATDRLMEWHDPDVYTRLCGAGLGRRDDSVDEILHDLHLRRVLLALCRRARHASRY